MVYEVVILDPFLDDVDELHDWIAKDDPHDALRWEEGLWKAVRSLASMPCRTALAPESETIGEDVRELIYAKNYRILYVVGAYQVLVVHVVHGARLPLTEDNF